MEPRGKEEKDGPNTEIFCVGRDRGPASEGLRKVVDCFFIRHFG